MCKILCTYHLTQVVPLQINKHIGEPKMVYAKHTLCKYTNINVVYCKVCGCEKSLDMYVDRNEYKEMNQCTS